MCNLSVMSTAGGAEIQLPVSDLKGLRVSKAWYLLTSRVVPDIRPFLLSGIRPDIRFHSPDIRRISCLKSKIVLINKIISIYNSDL